MPASPRLMAGLSKSASAGPIGCTSGLEALEFGAFDFGVLLPDFLGESGVFAMGGIWDDSMPEKRATGFQEPAAQRPVALSAVVRSGHSDRQFRDRHSGAMR